MFFFITSLLYIFNHFNSANEFIEAYNARVTGHSTVTATDDNKFTNQGIEYISDLKKMETLLNLVRLKSELVQVQEIVQDIKSKERLATALDYWMNCQSTDAFHTTYDALEDPRYMNGNDISQILANVATAVNVAKNTAAQHKRIEVFTRVLTFTYCRSLHFIYQWYTYFGEIIANELVKEYKQSLQSNTSDSQFQSFFPLMAVIVDWIGEYDLEQNIKSFASDKLRAQLDGSALPTVASSDTSKKLKIPAEALAFISVQNITKSSFPTLPKLSSNLKSNSSRENFAAEIWILIVSHFLIDIHLQPIDDYFNERHQKFTVAHRKARCICRGAILDALLEFLDDDGIFASIEIKKAIVTPTAFFENHNGDNLRLSAEILQKKPIFEPLVSELERIFDSAEIQNITVSLAEEVQKGAEKLAHGRYVKNPGRTSLGKLRRKQTLLSMAGPNDRVFPSTPLSDLLPLKTGFRVDMLACMLKEAIVFKNNQSERWDQRFGRIIRGQHPIIRTRQFGKEDQDHYDPIRHTNRFQLLLEEAVGYSSDPDRLKTQFGLSNLILRIGTGQGNLTEKFQRRYLNQFFESPESCIDAFIEGHTDVSGMAVDNMSIWGQPSSQLAFERISS